MKIWLFILCLFCLVCNPQKELLKQYIDKGYKIEWQGYALRGDKNLSYTLYNSKIQHRVSIDRGKRVVECPNDKALQDFWWWNITIGKEHNLQ